MERLKKIGGAVLIITGCFALQWVLWEQIRPYAWFIFSLGVFFSVLLTGLEGGLAATFLSAGLVWYFFVPPEYSWFPKDHNYYSLLGFIVTSFVYTFFGRHFLSGYRTAAEIAVSLRETTRLTLVMETVFDGLITFDVKGKITTYNAAAVRMFGYRVDEAVGRDIKTLIPAFGLLEQEALFSTYINLGVGGSEADGRHKDGTLFPVEVSLNETTIERVKTYVASFRDITERKRAEQALLTKAEQLSESEAQLRMAFNGIKDYSIVLLSLGGHIRGWNSGAERATGYSFEEANGRDFSLLFTEADCARGMPAFVLKVVREKGSWSGERLRTRKDGATFWAEEVIELLRNECGDAVGYVMGVRDVTERKRTEAERVRQLHELERSNQDLDDFAYIASHDLKEPLRGLYNNTQFLLEDYKDKLDGDGVQRLTRLIFLAQKMERLVSDLLYFSRLGRSDLAIQETDIQSVLVNVEHMLGSMLIEKNAKIVVPVQLPAVVCDKTRVEEVLLNLITNAIKYNDKPVPMVEVGFMDIVRAAHGVEKDVFYVRDNGIGIEAQYHQEVFRIFRRLSKMNETDMGTGSGLTFVKKIIERHHGHIWIESALGEGTTFFFNFGELKKADFVSAA